MGNKKFWEEIDLIRLRAINLLSLDRDNTILKNIVEGLEYSKKNNGSISQTDFISFVENYSTSFGLVGDISFDEEVTESELFYFFGWSDVHRLAVVKATNEIVMVDAYNLDRIVLFCAKNFESFLESFLINGIGCFEQQFNNDQERNKYYYERAVKAADAAGGEKYLNYWMHLWSTYDPSIPPGASNRGGLYN